MRRSLLSLVGLVLGLVGVSATAGERIGPFVTGIIFDSGLFLGRFTTGTPSAPRRLSEVQVQEISSWVEAHRSMLHMILASPPPSSCSVLLTDAEGRRVQLDLYSVNESWRHAVQIRISDKSGKFLDGLEMNAPTADIAELKEMLRPPS